MTPGSLHEFFAASVGAAAALIGLLFVAISVAGERLAEKDELQVHRIRANAALIAFVNSLTVGLFALIPGQEIGNVALVVAILGLLFVAGSLLSLTRVRPARWSDMRDAAFLLALLATFVRQLIAGLDARSHPGDARVLHTIAVLVVVCFLVGIARSWELIGGPSTGIGHEIAVRVRRKSRRDTDTGAEPGQHSVPAPSAPR